MKRKILILCLALSVVGYGANYVRSNPGVIAVSSLGLAMAAFTATAGGQQFMYDAGGAAAKAADSFAMAAGYLGTWLEENNPGIQYSEYLDEDYFPAFYGVPVYYGTDGMSMLQSCHGDPNYSYINDLIDQHTSEATLTSGPPVVGDPIICLTHMWEGSSLRDYSTISLFGKYDTEDRFITTLGVHKAGYGDGGSDSYWFNASHTYFYRVEEYSDGHPNYPAYWGGAYRGPVSSTQTGEMVLTPGAIDWDGAWGAWDGAAGGTEFKDYVISIPNDQIVVTPNNDDAPAPGNSNPGTADYGGGETLLTPSQIASAGIAITADGAQAKADDARYNLAADPTNPIAITDYEIASQQQAQAEADVAEQEIENEDYGNFAPPPLTAVEDPLFDFTPFEGLWDEMLTKQPFVWLDGLASWLNLLNSPPTPPAFTVDLGITEKTIDFSIFDTQAALLRAIMSFVMISATIFICVHWWKEA